MLSEADIEYIFSSDYKRTQRTGQPLADSTGLEIFLYDPGAQDSIAQELRSIRGNALVVGHSNTIPALINLLLGEERYEQLNESEYDKLFLLHGSEEKFDDAVMRY